MYLKNSQTKVVYTGIQEFRDAAESSTNRGIQFKPRNLNFGKVIFFIFPLNSQKDTFV
jgi:hypothetical protein